MITTGVLGGRWRASVTPWGGVEPWAGEPVDWYVAAEDRWHVPRHEAAVRQRRVDGTAVAETRLRVPSGDVVQRVWSVPDAGGLTVIEVANESPLPVAVAFDRRRLLTERPIQDVPIEGIELPAGAFVLPLGHRASIRVGLAHGDLAGALPAVPPAEQVVRGWLAHAGRASRFVLPDGAIVERVVAERCELALGSIPRADDDAAGFAVALGELVRMAEAPEPWLPELVDAVAALGPAAGWPADVGLAAAERVLSVAGEERARRDLVRIAGRRDASPRPSEVPAGCLVVPWIEAQLASGTDLLPGGLLAGWLGQSIEAYGVPTGAESTLSLAIRWHGDRPAVLWEQTGPPVTLSAPVVAPGWTSSEARGEALWPPVG